MEFDGVHVSRRSAVEREALSALLDRVPLRANKIGVSVVGLDLRA